MVQFVYASVAFSAMTQDVRDDVLDYIESRVLVGIGMIILLFLFFTFVAFGSYYAGEYESSIVFFFWAAISLLILLLVYRKYRRAMKPWDLRKKD
jgi:phosphate starvation-inducible membrane PsiE